MKKYFKVFALILLGMLIIAQLVPVSRTNPPELSPLKLPSEVENILQKACFDCHSNKTKWPWYTRVAPISWWIVDHVQEGREELNFSDWNSIPPNKRGEKFEEIGEEVEEGEMPLASYTMGHPEARLSQREIQILRDWAKSQERSDT